MTAPYRPATHRNQGSMAPAVMAVIRQITKVSRLTPAQDVQPARSSLLPADSRSAAGLRRHGGLDSAVHRGRREPTLDRGLRQRHHHVVTVPVGCPGGIGPVHRPPTVRPRLMTSRWI